MNINMKDRVVVQDKALSTASFSNKRTVSMLGAPTVDMGVPIPYEQRHNVEDTVSQTTIPVGHAKERLHTG